MGREDENDEDGKEDGKKNILKLTEGGQNGERKQTEKLKKFSLFWFLIPGKIITFLIQCFICNSTLILSFQGLTVYTTASKIFTFYITWVSNIY